MVISGGKSKDGTNLKVITGHGAFVMPGLRRAAFLGMEMKEAEVQERCVTNQGIQVQVRAVIAFKVSSDPESIVNAAQRFLADQNSMEALTGRIFAGHLRSVVGSMTMEEIVTERQKLATEVLDGSKAELAKLGLLVDSFQIESVDDRDEQGQSVYISPMSAPHRAAIARAAATAQSEADRAAAEAQQQSVRKQAEYQRDTEVTKAGYLAEVNTANAQSKQKTEIAQAQADQATQVAQAEADQAARVARAKAQRAINEADAEAAQAGPLAQAKASQEVAREATALAAQRAAQTEQELLATVVKPAEADAQRTRLAAAAEAESTRLKAEAAVAGDRVSLDQMIIEALPGIVREAASGLSGAQLTVLNGSDGLSEVVSSLVSQGLDIMKLVRDRTGEASKSNGLAGGRQLPTPERR